MRMLRVIWSAPVWQGGSCQPPFEKRGILPPKVDTELRAHSRHLTTHIGGAAVFGVGKIQFVQGGGHFAIQRQPHQIPSYREPFRPFAHLTLCHGKPTPTRP
jgi:hypothetical protein